MMWVILGYPLFLHTEVGCTQGPGDPLRASAQAVAAPIGDVEGWVGEDVVGLQVRVAVIVKTVALFDLPLDAANREVHLGHAPRGVVGFLAVDGDVALGFAAIAVAGFMGADELHRLHEHARGTAAGVIDAAAVGFQHLHEEADDAAGRIELAALATLGERELLQEVLIDLTEDVRCSLFSATDLDVADEIDDLAEAGLVQGRAGIVLGEDTL